MPGWTDCLARKVGVIRAGKWGTGNQDDGALEEELPLTQEPPRICGEENAKHMARRSSPKSKEDSDEAPPSVNGNGGFEAQLFLAADKLRKNLEPSDYKHVVLGLIFLRHVSAELGGPLRRTVRGRSRSRRGT